MPSHLLGLLGTIVPVAVQFILFLRWLHRRMRADEVARAFVRDLAVAHLPHIYTALREIARRLGIGRASVYRVLGAETWAGLSLGPG